MNHGIEQLTRVGLHEAPREARCLFDPEPYDGPTAMIEAPSARTAQVDLARHLLAAQAGDATALRAALPDLADAVDGSGELLELTCGTAFMRRVEHRDAAREALS